MGKTRPNGKVKKKSVKARSVQKMGSNRRLSRFGKERKRGESGIQSAFVSRTQILKKLQLTLKDFRRLCILKGIYPRDPRRNLKSGKDKTYYHYKDVQHLSHEPLIAKFRDFKAFMKKVRKTLGRRDQAGAKRLYQDQQPTYTLHHLVKERYPMFEDALRDLDDALNLVHMFAALPAAGRVTSERTKSCRDLVCQWQFYILRARKLNKCFVSVKGVYFQASLFGVDVTWINPHEYTQHVPSDVDFRTMLTFLEFYETLLKFTLFKLFHSEGLRYPPTVAGGDGDGAFAEYGQLLALRAESLDGTTGVDSGKGADEAAALTSAQAKSVEKKYGKAAAKRSKQVRKQLEAQAVGGNDDEEEDDEGSEELRQQLEDALVSATGPSKGVILGGGGAQGESGPASLFNGLVFFLSRESQYSWLEFAVRSCGGDVGWAGADPVGSADDLSITHVVYDRPVAPQAMRCDVEYVQPQWILDSVNVGMRLPLDRYRPGVSLPPHLSPFVDDAKEGYMPAYRTELNALKSAAEEYGNLAGLATSGAMSVAASVIEDGEFDSGSEEDEGKVEDGESGSDQDEVERSDEEEEEEEEGAPGSAPPKHVDEEKELALTMMSKKARRLYGHMKYGIAKKKDASADLQKKREAADERPGGHAPAAAPKPKSQARG